MDDGEVDSPSSGGGALLDPYSFLEDSSITQNDWDTLIGTQICSHKHICNPTTGPDNTHTHTCEHTHTHTIGSGDDEKLTKKRRPSGNKEAVRKYREKQKAVKVNLEVRNAELEKENQRIPELQKENLRLRRKLQEEGPRQDAVEHLLAENKRLKGLLSQFRRAIDSELDGLGASYQNLIFTPTKVDRFLPVGAHCAAPVPCFPVANNHTGGLAGDQQHTERNLGWHADCEMAQTVTACRGPQQESEDDAVGSHPCVGFKASKPSECADNEAIPLACSKQSVVNAAIAEKQSSKAGLTVKTAIGGTAAYQQSNVAGESSCPMTSLPLPCFDDGSEPAVASLQAEIGPLQEVKRWPEVCDLGSRDADSSSLPCPSRNTPDDGRQSASTVLSESTLVSPSSKKARVGTGNEVELFPSGCFYPDDVTSDTADCWNQHLLSPNDQQGWLERCDIIDGVCQAHLANAIQGSCFKPPGEPAHDSSIPAVPLPSTIQISEIS